MISFTLKNIQLNTYFLYIWFIDYGILHDIGIYETFGSKKLQQFIFIIFIFQLIKLRG